MKLFVYSIFDKGVQAFMSPFYTRAQGEAVRVFEQLINDKNTNCSKWPADFTMYRLGSYDDSNGFFECSEPVRVITGMEVLNQAIQSEAAIPGISSLDRRAM